MGQLDNIKIATFTGPTRLALHSVEGFGKTTLAAHFPKPLFVCGERGFPRDLTRTPVFVEPKNWEDVRSLVRDLITGQHDYGTLVFDTMDWIEPLIHRYLLARDSNQKSELNQRGSELTSIESYGYGKGYIAASEEMRALLGDLDELQTRRGMHIVILMHSHVKKFTNPAGLDFDRWQPKMHERCARLVIEWCENVLFGMFEILSAKEDVKDKKGKGSSTGRRILGARHNAMYDAKNRYNLPELIELNAPADLVPYLLGKHIKAPPIESAPVPKVEPFGDTNGKIAAEYEKVVAQKKPAATADATHEMAQIGAMLDDVEKFCGPKLRKDIEKWVAAADTAEKLNWCFAEAAKNIATAKKKASAQPASA